MLYADAHWKLRSAALMHDAQCRYPPALLGRYMGIQCQPTRVQHLTSPACALCTSPALDVRVVVLKHGHHRQMVQLPVCRLCKLPWGPRRVTFSPQQSHWLILHWCCRQTMGGLSHGASMSPRACLGRTRAGAKRRGRL